MEKEGIPQEHRGRVWMAISGATRFMAGNEGMFEVSVGTRQKKGKRLKMSLELEKS